MMADCSSASEATGRPNRAWDRGGCRTLRNHLQLLAIDDEYRVQPRKCQAAFVTAANSGTTKRLSSTSSTIGLAIEQQDSRPSCRGDTHQKRAIKIAW